MWTQPGRVCLFPAGLVSMPLSVQNCDALNFIFDSLFAFGFLHILGSLSDSGFLK